MKTAYNRETKMLMLETEDTTELQVEDILLRG